MVTRILLYSDVSVLRDADLATAIRVTTSKEGSQQGFRWAWSLGGQDSRSTAQVGDRTFLYTQSTVWPANNQYRLFARGVLESTRSHRMKLLDESYRQVYPIVWNKVLPISEGVTRELLELQIIEERWENRTEGDVVKSAVAAAALEAVFDERLRQLGHLPI